MEDYEADFHIGSVKVWIKSLAYMIELKEQLEITNFSGQAVGLLNVRDNIGFRSLFGLSVCHCY